MDFKVKTCCFINIKGWCYEINYKYFIFAISLSIHTLARMPLLPMLSSNQLTTSTQRQQTARFTLTECLDCGNIMSVLVFGVLPSPPQRTGKQFAQQTVIFVCFLCSVASWGYCSATGSSRRCYGNKAAWCVPHWARSLTRIRLGEITIRGWFAGICRIDMVSFLSLLHVGNERR